MIIYCAILFGIQLIGLGNDKEVTVAPADRALGFLLVLPVFGRIFGWW